MARGVVTDPHVEVASHDAWTDRYPGSPYHADLRRGIHDRESMPTKSSPAGYGAFNPPGAWGQYQMTKGALRDIGMMNDVGKWTGRYGIHTDEDFLGNPEVQERAFEAYTDELIYQMNRNQAWDRRDTEIQGIKAPFAVTEAGLVAAAHRRGAKGVKDYLKYLEERNWRSDIDTIRDPDRRQKFLDIETRLREFSGVPLLRE